MNTSDPIETRATGDARPLSIADFWLFAISFLMMLSDGYDIAATAFAAPLLAKSWGLGSVATFGPVFSASLVGFLFGAPLFGLYGDKFGRKAAVVLACIVTGAATCWSASVGDVHTLMLTRLIAGIGIGGILPNVIALNSECLPARWKGSASVVLASAVTLGGAIPGLIVRTLTMQYGWSILFIIGGVMPLVMAVVGLVALRESPKFLEARNAARQLGPESGKTSAKTSGETACKRLVKPGTSLLFAGSFRIITPMFWLVCICAQLCFFFVQAWLPTVLTMAHIPGLEPSMAMSVFQIGGTVGALLLARPFGKFGLAPLPWLFLLGIPATCALGGAYGSPSPILIAAFISGIALLGIQCGLAALSALIYPTAVRATGSGWAFGIGRIGAILGPLVAGSILATGVQAQSFFLFLAVPLTLGALASWFTTRQIKRQKITSQQLMGFETQIINH